MTGGLMPDPSKIRQELSSLIQDQSTLQKSLLQNRDKMVRGSLFQCYTACRKGHCKCTQGEKHGPFLYVALRVKGKTVQRYVGKIEDEGLVRKLKAYREFRRQRKELNQLNGQIYREWNRLEDSLIEGKIR